MHKKKILIYLVLPAAVNLILIGAYFSGVSWLQSMVSPKLLGFHPDTGRELGLLENLQNVCLLAIMAIIVLGIKRKKTTLERWILVALLGFSVFVFLEEIDYGLHFYEYMRGVPFYEAAVVRNVHNIGGATDVFKKLADTSLVLLFVILPLAFAKSKRPFIRYLTPDRYSILTMVAMVTLSKLAHFLADAGVGTPGSIHKNISEFREFMIYYLCAVYLGEVILRRTYPPQAEIPAEEALKPESAATQ